MESFSHVPVLLEECMEGLNLKSGGIYYDATVGGGGHSYEILRRTAPGGRLIATDMDSEAVEAATGRLKPFEGRFGIYKSNYKNFGEVLDNAGIDKLDGILVDMGVSSHQLDDKNRGFSYMRKDAPLDMRMDQNGKLTAAYIVNNYSGQQIAKILKEYGEEPFANSIAANILRARTRSAIDTCGALADIIEGSIPAKFKQNGPAARKSFQALRIAVNEELTGLYDCIISLTRRLKKGGRIAVISFHSLEDRIVKQAFRYLELDCVCDKSIPVCVCGKVKEIEILTKKPVVATEEERENNSRSKSAKLRIAQKIN